MNNIKTYREFVNEEISLGNILRTGALATSLALSNPSQANISEPVKTEMTQQSIDWQDDVKLPGMSKSDIKTKLYQRLSQMPGTRIKMSTPDKIVCSITMSAKPNNSNGQTQATIEIDIRDGEYTVKFVNINFIYVGQQPPDVGYNVGQNIKGQIGSELSRTVVRGSGNTTLGNMAGSAILGATRPQPKEYKNFTYQEAKNSRNLKYTSQVDQEIMSIVTQLR
jgi:hypothetical protein